MTRALRSSALRDGWARAVGCAALLAWSVPAVAPAQGNAQDAFWVDAPQRRAPGMSGSLAALASRVAPSVVALQIERPARLRRLPLRQLGGAGPDPVHGTAFVITRDGYAITVHSLIAGARSIRAQLPDGRTPEVSVTGVDPRSRIALIKLQAEGEFEPLPLGDALDTTIGDWVVALGHPDEEDWERAPGADRPPTLAKGILSGRGRRVDSADVKLLQTDLVLADGYSGAPLVDMNGFAIGVVDQTLRPEGVIGIGFAVPIREAKRVLAPLRTAGEVRRGWLGVAIQPVTTALARSFDADVARGALVSDVLPGTPAEAARLRRGDVILEVQGTQIERFQDLIGAVSALEPGTPANLVVLRDGSERQLTAVLGTAPTREPSADPADLSEAPEESDGSWGFEFENLTDSLARRYGFPEGSEGIVITRVEPRGPAARAELHQGDLILEINREPVRNTRQLERALEEEDPLLWVQRSGGSGSAYRVLERP